jgi:hypothetical protein
MENPLWMLVPWLVFAIGMGVKFWRLGVVLNKFLGNRPPTTEAFRRTLERIWTKDQKHA